MVPGRLPTPAAGDLSLVGVTGSSVDPRDLRVSDAERTHVMSLLQKATGRGLISLGEFSDRSAMVIRAKTRGELNAVLLDLPGLSIAGRSLDQAREQTGSFDPSGLGFVGDQPAGFAAGAPAGQQVSGAGRPATLELMGWGSRVYKGYWVVPSRIVIGGAGASTKLDFSTAALTSSTVRLEFLGNSFGSVDLIVPAGTGIRLDGLQLRGGTIDNRVAPTPGPWPLVLEFAGVKRGGSLRIRPSKRRR